MILLTKKEAIERVGKISVDLAFELVEVLGYEHLKRTVVVDGYSKDGVYCVVDCEDKKGKKATLLMWIYVSDDEIEKADEDEDKIDWGKAIQLGRFELVYY